MKLLHYLKKNSIFKICFLNYIFLSFIFNSFIIEEEFIKTIIGAPHLFLMPCSIGNLFYKLLSKSIRLNFKRKVHFVVELTIYWVFGLFLITLVALILQLFNGFSVFIFSLIVLLLYISGILYFDGHSKLEQFDKKRFTIFLVILLIGLIPLIILKLYTGFPGSYSIVVYRFNHISESIIQRNIIILEQQTDYLPIFPIVISAISYIFNVETISLFWIGPFIIETIFFCGVYTFILYIFKERIYAFLSGIISLYILTWNTNFYFPPVFELQPRSITFAIFPYIFYLILKYYQNSDKKMKFKIKKNFTDILFLVLNYFIIFTAMFLTKHREISNRKVTISLVLLILILINLSYLRIIKSNKFYLFNLLIFFITLPLFHTLESFYYFFVLFLLIIFKHIEMNTNGRFSIKKISLLYSISSLILMFLLFLIITNIIFIDPEFFRLFDILININTNPNIFQDFLICLQSITIPISVFVFIYMLKIIFKASDNQLNNQMVLIFLIVLLIYLMPIMDIVRIGGSFVVFITFFIISFTIFIFHAIDKLKTHFLVITFEKFMSRVIGKLKVASFVNTFKKSIFKMIPKLNKKFKKTYIKGIILLIIIIPLIFPFVNYIENKQNQLNSSNLSLYSYYEYNMGIWIRDNTPSNSIIISDPETVYLISGISGREIIIPTVMLVQDLRLEDHVILDLIKNNILKTLDPEMAYNYSSLLGKENTAIIIISGRTLKWISQNSYQFIQKPFSFYNTTCFEKFFNNSYFRFLKKFGEDEIFAFELALQNTTYFKNYDIYTINDIENFDNITEYSNNLDEAVDQWYLDKRITIGPVITKVTNQYICQCGNPPIIKWTIINSKNYQQISLYTFNLNILNIDTGAYWNYSKNQQIWISGNFSNPLQHVFDFKIDESNLIEFFGHNANKSNWAKLGSFVFIGFYD